MVVNVDGLVARDAVSKAFTSVTLSLFTTKVNREPRLIEFLSRSFLPSASLLLANPGTMPMEQQSMMASAISTA